MKETLFIGLAMILVALPCRAQSMSGFLGSGDAEREGGIYYDAMTVALDSPRKLTVRMTSPAFDTYLIVRSPSGQVFENDDFGSQEVSQLDLWATEVGSWTVWATSYAAGAVGDYEGEIETGDAIEVEILQGRLDSQDSTALKGEYFDTHTVDLSGDRPVVFELLSLGFDGYLVVTGPDGQVQRNDDAGSTDLSRIGPLRGAGKWRLDVTSVSAGERGAYDLKIIRLPK